MTEYATLQNPPVRNGDGNRMNRRNAVWRRLVLAVLVVAVLIALLLFVSLQSGPVHPARLGLNVGFGE